jgi:PKD repeat protein
MGNMKAIRRCLRGPDLFRGQSKGSSLSRLSITILCLFLFAGLAMALSETQEKTPPIGVYGQLPLYFIQNEGQLPDKVKYYEKGLGHSIFFSEEEVVFSFERTADHYASDSEAEPTARFRANAGAKLQERGTEFSVVRLFPVGTQKGIRIDGQEQQEGRVNYFIGKDPGKWRTDIATYGSVVYHEAYPGVDIRFYGSNRELEYDVIIKPGANPSLVRFGYEGIQDFRITARGDLSLQLPDGGTLVHRKPVAYQEIEGKRIDIEGRFHIEPESPTASPDNHGFVFGFEVASYHSGYPLIIDPVLVYSTYLGGLGSDAGNAIAIDAPGNAYITGKTSSTNFPTTLPNLGSYAGGTADVFVTKLNAGGTALIYSTFLGGSDTDNGLGIAVDNLGFAYLTGETASDDFPTASAFANIPGSTGSTDAFVVKLNTTGSALIYSTYLGGALDDSGQGISVDKFGQACVSGVTSSTDFPIYGTALQHFYGGGYSDAFVAKLNNLGTAVVYSTFVGGTKSDAAYAIALDDDGNMYVAGETASSDFPIYLGFQSTYGGGDVDAFVMKINGSSGQAVYSSYLGGISADFGRGIAVDGSRRAYVTGKTSSPTFPVANAVQGTYGGGDADAFVARFTPSGDNLSYSTFLGGSGSDVGYAIAVDSNGNAYVTGRTSGNFPTIKAVQNVYGGGSSDAFVTRVNGIGDRIDYSTYLGGSAADFGYSIAAGTIGNVYLTGKTSSLDFPSTSNAFMNFNAAGSDIFVTKLNALLANFSANRTIGAFPLAVQFTDASEGSFSSWFWDFGDGNSSTVQNPGHVYNSPGSYTVSLSVTGNSGTDTLTRNAYITVTKPQISIIATDPVASEPGADKGQFTVYSSDPRDVPITITYNISTISGSATNGTDYTLLPGSVTIPAGQSSATITVSPIDDLVYEGPETVQLTITSGSLYDIGSPSTAVVTVLDNDLPTVSIAATIATVPEQGPGIGQFTVSRTGITNQPLTVNYTVAGTAGNGVDYETLTLSLTIPAASTSASISIKPYNDQDYEGDETVTIILVPSSSAYNVGTDRDTVTIVDNDLPVVAIATAVATVPEQGPGAAQMNVVRTGVTTLPLTIYYTVSGSAAVDGVDFEKLSGLVTIPAFASSALISVKPLDDLDFEGDETVTVTLTPAPAYLLGSSKTAIVTIVDNDLPTVTIAAAVATVPEQGPGSAQFTVSRTGITSSALTVSYGAAAGTATAGVDYGQLPGMVTFPVGAAAATILVTPIDDLSYEGEETVTLTLSPSASYNVGPNNTATITIVDNDLPTVTVAATDPSAYEADQESGHFTVYRTENTSAPLTVNYVLTGTAATNGTDYTKLSGTITIPQGSSSAVITVTPVDDEEFEGPETLVLTISPSSSYKVGSPASATLTIVDNDLPAVTVATTTPNILESAGTVKGEFKFSRTGVTSSALVVSYAVSGSATSGVDYVPLPLSVTIPAGAASASIFVTPSDDNEYEGNETIILSLAGSSLYNVASPNTARITIVDNDLPVVTVAATDPNASETDSDPGQFTITRTGITNSSLVVYFALSGAGGNGIDYNTVPTSVSIPSGSPSANVTVRPIDDAEYEGDETVVLILTADSSYQVGTPNNATVVIKDNDLPTVSIIATTPNASELGPTPGLFTVSRTGITTSSLTVNYTATGTATSGIDYAALPGSLVIPAGSPSATITLTPVSDDVVEGAETVDVTLLSSSSYNIGAPLKGTVTIADDIRPFVSVVATDANAAEKGPDTGQFTVSRTGATTEPLVVGYVLTGNAANGTDYALLTSPVTIPSGAASTTVLVTPLQDTEYEGPETVILTISPSQTYKIGGQNGATVSIADDDRPIVAIAATNPNAAESAVSGLFTVSRTGITTAPLTVSYAIGGTATNGVDYAQLATTVTIPAGVGAASFSIQPIDDTLMEGPETVIITISPSELYNVASPDNATVTIADDDLPTVTIVATDNRASEAGPDPGEFKISRTGNTTGALTVFYSTGSTGMGATNGVDYIYLPGQVVIPDGSSFATVQIMPLDDSLPEDRESVMLTITSNGWYKIGSPYSATLYIADNDLPTVTIVAVDDNASETGPSKGRFSVTRNSTQSSPLIVYYKVSGTAKNGTDCQKLNGTLSIPAGFASSDLSVVPVDDTEYQGDRTVVVTLTASDFYTVGTPFKGTVVIHDNDLPTVSISASVDSISEKATDPSIFTVTRTGNNALPLTVHYATPGTATNGVDYNALSGTVTIPADANDTSIQAVIINDSLSEGTETLIISLLADPGYKIGTPSSSTVSILDDEWPTVSIVASDDIASEPGIDTGKFTISRTGDTSAPLIVNYQVAGTGIPGTNYIALPVNVTIEANQSSSDIIVTPLDNKTVDPDKTVMVSLVQGASYYIDKTFNQATVLIVDDEKPEISIYAIRNASEAGGTEGQFRISRAGNNHSDSVVNYTVGAAAAGVAANGIDYNTLSGTIIVPAGQTYTTMVVTPIDDTDYEGDETVKVTLSPDSSYTLGSSKSASIIIVDNDLPVVTVVATDPTASESGTDTGQFTVSRTGITKAALAVKYTTGGTATKGTDYQTLSGSVTIPIGASSAVINVTPINDTETEGAETVVLTLSANAAYIVGSPSTDTVTIAASDLPAVSIAATDPTASKIVPDNGQFKISRNGATNSSLVVNYTRGGSATNGVDYQTIAATATIPAGQPGVTIDIVPIDNHDNDGNETVKITLDTGTAYTVGSPDKATVRILGIELPAVTVKANESSVSEGNTAGVAFTVTRTGTASSALPVNYVLGGTAQNGVDYKSRSGSLTIPAGSPSAKINIVPIDDTVYKEDKFVTIKLATSAQYLLDSPDNATMTILDNDMTVTMTVPDAIAGKPANTGRFKITRSGNMDKQLAVKYSIGGTAKNGADYQKLSGTATIPRGSSSVSILITALDDNQTEPNQTVTLELKPTGTYQIGTPNKGTVTILGDNLPTANVVATDPDASETGPKAGKFTLSRTGDTSAALKVQYTLAGTAKNGLDYVKVPETATIPAGDTSVNVNVTPIDDTIAEGVETVVLELIEAKAYVVGASRSAVVNIADND